jgi:putative ABC transport system substrate-binding protein
MLPALQEAFAGWEMQMERREFIALLGGAAAWPITARAQQPPLVGVLSALAFVPIADRVDAFHEGLNTSGFVEARNVAIEYRSAEGDAAQLPALAAELVRLDSKAIVCLASVNTVRAAKAATTMIPIVFAISGDPVELGLVANLDRPEANVTGAGRLTEALNPERLGVICELAPQAMSVGFLVHSSSTTPAVFAERNKEMEAAARAIGRQLSVLDLATEPELLSVFATMTQQKIGALVISTEALFAVWRDQVITMAAAFGIAVIFPNRDYAYAGGLISYGADLYEHYRVAGAYTGRILNGEKPADLPVQLPTKLDMVINLKAARAIGLTVPQSLLMRADEVIE